MADDDGLLLGVNLDGCVSPVFCSVNRQSTVLVISHDIVGRKMAGPGIRYWQLARVLTECCDVTLAVPNDVSGLSANVSGLTVQEYSLGDWSTLEPFVRNSDVMLLCGDTLAMFPALQYSHKPVVVDGYDPHTLETLALFNGMAEQDSRYSEREKILEIQCAVGDYFICASERQRDWWLGLLEAAGRVNPYTYSDDPSLRALVDVVPFGLPAVPPCHTKSVVKGVWPGVDCRDKVVLWGGGLWRWLDPFTAIRAMAQIGDMRDDVRLIFPGTIHPHPDMSGMPTWLEKARDLSRDLGLLDTSVFFGDWIPVEDWPNVLLESDIGLSLHMDTVETRLAFRTRVVDYIWAGLPMILTQGDATGELVASYGIGTLVDYEKTENVVQALLSLLDVPKDHFSRPFREARDRLSWAVVAQPLLDFCIQPRCAPDRNVRARIYAASEHGHDNLMGECGPGYLTLKETSEAQKAEIDRLRDVVAGYEGGRFIRLMRWLRKVRASLGL